MAMMGEVWVGGWVGVDEVVSVGGKSVSYIDLMRWDVYI